MNKTSQMMIYKIYINFLNIHIQTEELINPKIPGSIKINIKSDNISELTIRLDERYNKLHLPEKILSEKEKEIVEYLKEKFNKLKSSDISYGSTDDLIDLYYDPSKYIFIKDFFNYLKIENRESVIENTLK